MELALTPELEELIQRYLDSGRYETPYQVVANAVHQLGRNELNPDMTFAELDAALQEGMDDIDRGRHVLGRGSSRLSGSGSG